MGYGGHEVAAGQGSVGNGVQWIMGYSWQWGTVDNGAMGAMGYKVQWVRGYSRLWGSLGLVGCCEAMELVGCVNYTSCHES